MEEPNWPEYDRRQKESQLQELAKDVEMLKQQFGQLLGGINTIKWIVGGVGTTLTGLLTAITFNVMRYTPTAIQIPQHPTPPYQQPYPFPNQHPNQVPFPVPTQTPDTLPPEYRR